MFQGTGQNGKSKLLDVAQGILGEELSLLTDFSVLRQSDNDKHVRNNLASFLGKRLIVISESDNNQYLAEGFMKRVTGEATIVAEKKFGDPFTVPITFKLVMMTQHLPRIIGQDKGTWRRLRVIPFTYTIPEEERNKHFYTEVLKPELTGILTWAVQGSLLYQEVREQDILPQVCIKALANYQDETDFFGHFVEDCLLFTPEGFVSNEDMIEVMRHWGEKNNNKGLQTSGMHNIITMFKLSPHTAGRVRHGQVRVKGLPGDNRRRGFSGVSLRPTIIEAMRAGYRPFFGKQELLGMN